MKPLIKWFKKENKYTIVANCCGHNKYPMTLVAKFKVSEKYRYLELLSGIELYRKRNFYKRDEDGYYFIPELVKKI